MRILCLLIAVFALVACSNPVPTDPSWHQNQEDYCWHFLLDGPDTGGWGKASSKNTFEGWTDEEPTISQEGLFSARNVRVESKHGDHFIARVNRWLPAEDLKVLIEPQSCGVRGGNGG